MELGHWDKKEDEEEEEEEEAESEEIQDPGQSDSKASGGESIRSIYWAVIHEEQKKIKKANPDMKASEVLKLARASCFGCIQVATSDLSLTLLSCFPIKESHWSIKLQFLLSVTRWEDHPARLNAMKNMSNSELSRRRLKPGQDRSSAKKGKK